MSKSLISIIVPVYNVRKYLENCVNSLLSQTHRAIEIILIDDGATDGSGTLCDQLAERDNRIVVVHQKNGGLSDARNSGTKKARGNYIFYLDSDDYITADCLKKLHRAIKTHKADIAQANFFYDYADYLLFNNDLNGQDQVFTAQKAMELLIRQGIIKNFAWGKLIRAEIAKSHRFPKGKYFEDTFWKFHIINDSTTYVVLAEPLVYYLQRGSGISGAFSMKNLHQLEGEAVRLEFLELHYPDLIPLAKQSLKNRLMNHYFKRSVLSQENQAEYLATIERYKVQYAIKMYPPIERIKRLFDRIAHRLWGTNHYVKIKK